MLNMPAPHRDMMQCWNEFAMILLVLFCFFLKCETRCGRRNEKCLGGSTLLNSFFNKKKLCNECLTVVIAFDEGERIQIVSFLRKSLSRVLWTSPKGIDRDAMRFEALGAILDWLAGWLCGTNSLDLMCKCFHGCLELRTPIANMAAKMRVLTVR